MPEPVRILDATGNPIPPRPVGFAPVKPPPTPQPKGKLHA